MTGSDEQYVIRPYRPSDRPAVRDICVKTCWLGQYDPRRIPDDWIWAEYWTRYFTDREPENTWVVAASGGGVVGYLSGTSDVRRFERYVKHLAPGIVWRVLRRRLMRKRDSRRAILGMGGSLLRGELRLPPGVAGSHPATWHFNLLPEARGAGVGSRLFALFLARMKALGVPGIHSQPLSVNAAVGRILAKNGFRLLASWPVRTYRHIDPQPIELETWVREI